MMGKTVVILMGSPKALEQYRIHLGTNPEMIQLQFFFAAKLDSSLILPEFFHYLTYDNFEFSFYC